MAAIKYFLVFLLCIAAAACYGQERVYVNTNNLVVRDRPERQYNVFAILRPGCPLKVEPYGSGYKGNKAVKARFYRVSLSYRDDAVHGHIIFGWWRNGMWQYRREQIKGKTGT
jgi:hypothetical protein